MALVSSGLNSPPLAVGADHLNHEEEEEQPPIQAQVLHSPPTTSPIPFAPEPIPAPPIPTKIPLLSINFNQDHGCFACGTASGFRIYNCEPFKETFRRELQGGIGYVEMLFRCNILAVVGGGQNPRYSPNKVMIWDDHQNRCIGELSFRSEVRSVKLRRDRIVVALEHKIYVYNFVDLHLVQQIETIVNPKGLCALAPNSPAPILACPGLHKGQVRVEHYGLRKSKFITAHDSSLACFSLSHDGKLLATASTKGTLVRIFNTMDGTRVQEVRRGRERADIYSIAFSPTADWLAVSSDHGTVHVFSLKSPAPFEESRPVESPALLVSPASSPGSNPGSTLSFMKGGPECVLPKYFSSEWSFAQFRLPEEMYSIVAFGAPKHTILIVGMDGSFYKCTFDPVNGGEMIQQEYTKFMKASEEDNQA